MKLAACVILYNPDDSVVGNVMSYLDSVDKIWLIDNSDKMVSAIDPLRSEKKIQYVQLTQNFGIAYALNRACEAALEEGFDWILTMDQDSSIDVGKFFPFLNPDKNVAAIYAASFAGTKDRWIKPYDEYFNEIHYTITSGCVMSLDIWKSVGGFDENLFIDEVDHDMCMKIRNFGRKILTTRVPCLNHVIGVALDNMPEVESKTRFRPQPFRSYYQVRNSLIMVNRYIFTQPRFAINRVFNLGKNLFRIAAYYPHKGQYFRYVGKGGLDFLTKQKGKLKS
jgi:rhamnosyltransferase